MGTINKSDLFTGIYQQKEGRNTNRFCPITLNCVAFAVLIKSPSPHTAVFAAGAVLFLLSDVILILNTFGSQHRFSWRCANLMLYYVGQLLIAASLQLM